MLFTFIVPVHNFADDSSLSNIATTVDSLTQKLESEYKLAIKWFHENKIIINHDKFQAIVHNKHKSNNTDVNPSMSGGKSRSYVLKQT